MSKEAQDIPQGQPQEVIGGGVAKGVVKQLIAREDLVSTYKRDNKQLLYFNANGSWARIVSSVNTLTKEETEGLATGKKTIAEINGSRTLAFNNVLMGGTMKPNTSEDFKGPFSGGVNTGKTHSPIIKDSEGYITAGDKKDAAYQKYESLGFRPTPGITGVAVKSKGTYGSLREAEISVTVWSLEELEMMQALYLRPGYTLLLEWGHSLQLDSTTKSVNQADQFYKKFLQDKVKSKDIETDLKQLVKESDYNYDSMFGYVSNFSWSFRQDGGYDCTVKLISKGSVLESIAVTFDPSFCYPPSQFEKIDADKKKTEKKSIYHKLFAELDKLQGTESRGVEAVAEAGLDVYVDNVDDGVQAVIEVVTGDFDEAADLAVRMAVRTATFLKNLPSTFFGDSEALAKQLETPQSTNAKQVMVDTVFVNKWEKLLKRGSTKYDGDRKRWDANRGVMDLEEEELVDYLTKSFGEYGIKFEEAGSGDNLKATAINGKVFEGECDNTAPLDDFNETLRLMEFLQENSFLPIPEVPENSEPTPEVLQRTAQQEAAKNSRSLEQARGFLAIEPIFTINSFNQTTGAYFKDNLNSFVAFRLKDLEYKDTGTFDNDDVNGYWLPLGIVLDVFNNYISIVNGTQEASPGTKTKGKKLTEFYTGWQDKDTTKQEYEKKLKYLTNEFHFSIDPLKCILPKKPKTVQLKDSKQEIIKWGTSSFDGVPEGNSYPMGLIWKNGFHYNVESAFNNGLLRGGEDDILNILIPVEFLKKELDKIIDKDKDSDQNEANNMVSFMRTILGGMTEALGGINDFDLFYDEGDDLFYIVDRKVTPPLKNFIPTLNLSGLKSTVTNLSIDSKISSNIASMISIAAQGTGGHTKDNIKPMLEWNRGLLDRHIIHKAQKNTVGGEQVTEKRESPEDDRLRKWVEEFQSYWEEFNGMDAFDNGDYNAAAVGNVKNYHKEFCKTWVVDKLIFKKESPIPPPGVIPVELSFTMMGIAGLKIGQAFKIAKGLLPQEYADRFGYIITGLSHNIKESKWTTDIKTQFYSMVPPTQAEIDAYEETHQSTVIPAEEGKGGFKNTQGTTTAVILNEGTPIKGDKVDYDTIKAAVTAKGYQWDDREWAINMVGIRNYSPIVGGKLQVTDKFDDIFTVSWIENGNKKSEKFACTTEPGKTYTSVKYGNKKRGTAILKEQQYLNAYRVGTHKYDKDGDGKDSFGKAVYPAFVQSGELIVWRDKTLDNVYDFVNPQTSKNLGINIHRAGKKGETRKIKNYSAGCQVLDKATSLHRLLQLASQAKSKINQKKYTYTLLNSNDITV